MRALLVACVVLALGAPAVAAERGKPPETFAPIADSVKATVLSVVRPGHEDDTDDDWFEGDPLGELLEHRPGVASRTLGAAVVIDPAGIAVTSARVLRDMAVIELVALDGRRHRATIVGRDERTDIAVLRVAAPPPMAAARFGDSDEVRVGDWVLAVGSPYGFEASVSAGIVSARARVAPGGAYADLLQTDVGVSAGHAGGPLVDTRGHVIGLTTMAGPRGWGIAFALPSNVVRKVVDDLVAHGRVVRSWLGVAPQALTPELARALKTPFTGGLLLADVVAGGPAAKAGLARGAILLALDERPLRAAKDLDDALAATEPGRKATLAVWRNGRPATVRVTLAQEPDPRHPVEGTRELFGLVLEAITPEGGVFVSRVAPGSAGAAAGVVPGDVVRQIAERTIRNVIDVEQAARDLAPDASTMLLVQRGRTPFYVVIPPPR
jgi:serine protease Do